MARTKSAMQNPGKPSTEQTSRPRINAKDIMTAALTRKNLENRENQREITETIRRRAPDNKKFINVKEEKRPIPDLDCYFATNMFYAETTIG